MIKICDASICKPLELTFRSCLENEKFPTEWKKANVVPAHKKGDKTTVQYLCFLLLEEYLKEYCIMTCMNSLQKII